MDFTFAVNFLYIFFMLNPSAEIIIFLLVILWYGNYILTQQAHRMESTYNWGGKSMDTCSTKNPGVFHVDLFCVLLVLIYTWIPSEVWALFFFTCNPRCISHVDYRYTFSGVFHVNCVKWINGVPVHVNITWILCEECHLILFYLFPTCIFHMDYWCIY